jgi:hypothetical protein
MAEMLNTEASYGLVQSGPPMAIRNGAIACGRGTIECRTHSNPSA